MIEHFPFMLSLSKHSDSFFSNLLRITRIVRTLYTEIFVLLLSGEFR